MIRYVAVDLETDGQTTIAHVGPLGPTDLDHLGLTSLESEMTRGLVGVGIARCRPEDHYDQTIGTYIAVSRAMADIAAQIEARAVAAVVTERQYQLSELGKAGAAAINEVIETFNEAIAAAGAMDRIVSAR